MKKHGSWVGGRVSGVCARRLLLLVLLTFISSPCFAANYYESAMERVQNISKSDSVRLLDYGKTEKGRAIPAFAISNFDLDSGQKTRVLVCAGQHGDEPNPVSAAMTFCESLAAGKYGNMLDKCLVIVVPAVNPDGLCAGTRKTSALLDTNRDWSTLHTPETRFVHSLIRQWRPHLIIDLHEWNSNTSTSDVGIEIARCGSDAQRNAMLITAARASREAKLSTLLCSGYSDSSLMHRRYSSIGYAAFLIETPPNMTQSRKESAYISAIRSMTNTLIASPEKISILSPAATGFSVAALKPYLTAKAQKPVEPVNRPHLLVVAILAIGMAVLIITSRPKKQVEDMTWQQRLRKCENSSEF